MKRIILRFIFISSVLLLSAYIVHIFNIGCLFKKYFHIPCPSCGMTRAYISLMNFDILGAFYYHPMFFIVPLVVFLASAGDIIFKNRKIYLYIILIIIGICFFGVYIYRLINNMIV